MSKIIECQVNDEYVLGSGVVIGAAGSYGDVILRLKFNEMWDGLAIMATFRDALNKSPVVIMLVPSMLVDGEVRTYEVPVPAEAKQIAGRARLTLTGYSIYTIEDNGTITPYKDSLTNTSTAFFRVLESDSAIVDDGSIVDATFAQQAQAEINRARAIMDEAEAAVGAATDKIAEFDEAENGLYDAEGNLIVAGRVQAEEERKTAENERKTAENERKTAENERNRKFAEIESLVGTIDECLDAIIAIQNSLIGGDA